MTAAWLGRLLLIIAAFCVLFAAVTAASGDMFRADASAWLCGGLAAAALSLALGFASGTLCTAGPA
jgi:hypothetical protein